MKSIRLSLVLYFVALLGVALGAVSILCSQLTHQTLLAKQETTKKLLEAQYADRRHKEEARFDDALLDRAQALAQLVQFRSPWSRLRYRELHLLGMLTAGPSPNAQLLTPIWVAQGTRSSINFETARVLGVFDKKTDIQFDESVLHQDGALALVPEYFQIDTSWGSSYHSHSLGGRSLPLDTDEFAADEVLKFTHDDVTLEPGQTLRRIVLKVPVPQLLPYASSSSRPHRGQPPSGPIAAADFRRPALFIQYASSTEKRDAALAGFRGERDEALAGLDAETDDSLRWLRNWLVAISLVTFAAVALGGFALVRRGLAPLQRLSEAVSQVSPRDFRLPLDQRSLPHELTGIAQRLDQTLDMLKRAFAREKQAAADISHELRTPLAALLTTTEVALRKQRTLEEYRELLEDCRASGQQMNRLVERLLLLARLDSGVDTLRPREVDVSALAEQCAALVRPLAEARSLRLRVRTQGQATLQADPDKLREVLTNLLHNAIQYNRPEGSVEVSVARHNGHLNVEVRDTGIGISPEACKHVFERFYRADPSRQSDGLNAGLGLAIVKGYVDLMGGSITLESTEGEGSTFCVQLPASA